MKKKNPRRVRTAYEWAVLNGLDFVNPKNEFAFTRWKILPIIIRGTATGIGITRRVTPTYNAYSRINADFG